MGRRIELAAKLSRSMEDRKHLSDGFEDSVFHRAEVYSFGTVNKYQTL